MPVFVSLQTTKATTSKKIKSMFKCAFININ